ncbi:hypothetical protein BKA81DRAFT_149978 [Phyllosticta paracitricarpa]
MAILRILVIVCIDCMSLKFGRGVVWIESEKRGERKEHVHFRLSGNPASDGDGSRHHHVFDNIDQQHESEPSQKKSICRRDLSQPSRAQNDKKSKSTTGGKGSSIMTPRFPLRES